MSYQYSFEKLEVWIDARFFVKEIYSVTKSFPKEESYILCSQMQRAAISISSNIAEGVSRISKREKIRFLEIAYGSLMEVYSQMHLALDLNYMGNSTFESLKLTVYKISNKLNALMRSFNN
ncbi:four helix bundle protein [Paludibacteraceae bacterium OttesenSCG-928-F17]|nr:four helix bundle protein [Paludibacteraceae bacterium OttesenSCG-928-F17]